jgi:recombination protein U
MSLEDDINTSNEYYKVHQIALIHKKPTPVQVVKVNYPSRNKAVITEAYYRTPSTTDYNGVYKGKYIDFECKETNHKSSYPFQNIHNHQIEHMKDVYDHGGIAFLIIRLNNHGQTYLYDINHMMKWVNSSRKSIPIDDIIENGIVIKSSYLPRLDYIKAIDEYYFGGKSNE